MAASNRGGFICRTKSEEERTEENPTVMKKIANFFTGKEPDQIEHDGSERVEEKYQKLTVDDVNFAKDARTELERSTDIDFVLENFS